MKKAAFCFVLAVVLLTTPVVFAGGTPEVDIKGTVMQFPKEDKIPSLDISEIKFSLSKEIPNGDKIIPLFGKVFRGQYKGRTSRGEMLGTLNYMFISQCNETQMVWEIRNDRKMNFQISCPVSLPYEFSCSRVDGGSMTKWRLSIKKGLPSLDATDGFAAEFREAGIVPEEVLEKE